MHFIPFHSLLDDPQKQLCSSHPLILPLCQETVLVPAQ
jgi:hypothetical protein